MLQNKKFRTRAREIEGAPRRTQPGASGIAPPSRIVPRGQIDVVILFFFFVILTDKTDAGRRDRERLFITMLYLPISQNASVRERNLNTNFRFWYKLSPPERVGKIEFESQRCVEIRILPFARSARRREELSVILFPATTTTTKQVLNYFELN